MTVAAALTAAALVGVTALNWTHPSWAHPVAPHMSETAAWGSVTAVPGPTAPALELDEIEVLSTMLDVHIEGGGPHQLDALVIAPRNAQAGDALPAIVISHGNPRDVSFQRSLRLHRFAHLGQEFARRGYVAFVVARRGFARSSGAYDEWYGRCDSVDADGYEKGGRTGAKDYAAALAAASADPRVDPTRLLALGQSGGGFAALALASDAPPGLRGVINFAGGRGSLRDGENCNADALAAAFDRFGRPDAAPSLWLYSITDRFFSPEMARRHFAAFDGPARLAMFGPIAHAADGHRLSQRGETHTWRPVIDDFLRAIGMPTWESPPDDPFTLDIAAPPGLGDAGVAEWRSFLGSEMHRAFAIGPEGRVGWGSAYPTRADAAEVALNVCRRAGSDESVDEDVDCRVYMIDETRE